MKPKIESATVFVLQKMIRRFTSSSFFNKCCSKLIFVLKLGTSYKVCVIVCAGVACATPPKPTALLAYEALQKDPNIEETRKHFPDIVASAEQYGKKADEE